MYVVPSLTRTNRSVDIQISDALNETSIYSHTFCYTFQSFLPHKPRFINVQAIVYKFQFRG